jgi:hypothetical protein
LLTLCIALAASAQQTMPLGKMLDYGGRKLDKAEMRQLFSVATMSGAQSRKHQHHVPKYLFSKWFRERRRRKQGSVVYEDVRHLDHK